MRMAQGEGQIADSESSNLLLRFSFDNALSTGKRGFEAVFTVGFDGTVA